MSQERLKNKSPLARPPPESQVKLINNEIANCIENENQMEASYFEISLPFKQQQFDIDLPEYRTHGGVHVSDKRVTAPPIMWVKALDMLMEKLRILGVDFSKVSAISGAGQVRFSF